MPRLLVAALPLLAGLLPLSAWALGLGEITLRSALNQPFRAEIPVSADSAEELSRLEVVLAPRETFQRFGLDRPAFLGDISLAVEGAGARDGVIRITSSRPITEPFVTLLIEARWPAGRLLREYTVLLDPPAFVSDEGRAPAALPAAPAAAPVEAIRRPAPAPAPVPAAAPAARPAQVTAGSGYQVQRSDTLWQVARDLRPDPSVSVNQMMVALFRANPEAFAGNINRLRAGAILRVPGTDELRGLAATEANAEVARQNAAWRDGQGERLQLLPPGELPPTGTGAGAAEAGALQSRVSQLESELSEARRLLSIRDDELRALQARLAGEAPAGREEPVIALPPADPFTGDEAPPVAEPAEESEAGSAAAEPAPAAAESAPAAAEPASVRAVTSQAPAGGSLLDTLLGLLTSVWLWGAAAVVVALSLFLIRRRREEAALADDEDTGRWSAPREPTIPPVAAAAGAEAPRGFIVEERAPLAEPAADSLDQTRSAPVLRMPAESTGGVEAAAVMAGDGGESTDVVAEADFHMAYGLYDQAADLLNEAIAAEPGRRDLRMKLLEVLFVWENKGAFLRAAQELHLQVDSATDPDWSKAVIMGKQICPEDPLFAGVAAPAVGGDLDFSLDSEQSAGTVDFSIDETGAQKSLSDLDIGEADAGLDFDFDPGEPADESGQATTSVSAALGGGTMETPTLQARFSADSPTMESPTLQVPGSASPTMETPTIETRGAWLDEPDPELTEAIDLDELGLDFRGLDEAADALSTGLHQALDEAAGSLSPTEAGLKSIATDDADLEPEAVFDFSDELESMDEDPAGMESTEEMPDLGDALGNQELDALSTAMNRDDLSGEFAGDTAEQPQLDRHIDDTAEQPRLAVDETVDFDIGEALEEEDFEPTASVMAGTGRLGSDGPTMTEVGTKLDLARAYIDMGDPDGARSILNEVLEEGDAAQRQEARQLLGELAD